jgi:hypothetical protein
MKRAACLIILMSLVFEARAQTLADFARMERQRQQGSTSRVYTNDNIASSAGVTPEAVPPVSDQQPAETAEVEAKAQPSGPLDNKGRGEQYWRNAFTDARTELKRAEDLGQVLENGRSELNTQLLRQSNVFNADVVIRTQITAIEVRLADTRKQADAARQKIADLEEELRRSNGLPGWAR